MVKLVRRAEINSGTLIQATENIGLILAEVAQSSIPVITLKVHAKTSPATVEESVSNGSTLYSFDLLGRESSFLAQSYLVATVGEASLIKPKEIFCSIRDL